MDRYYDALDVKTWAKCRSMDGYNLVYSFEGEDFGLDVDVPPADINAALALTGLDEQRKGLEKIKAQLRSEREAVVQRELDREDW